MDSQDYTRPDFSAAALVIIDTQAGFLDGRPYEIPGTTALLPAMRSLAAAFRQASKPIIHIVIIYKSRWGAFYRTPLENLYMCGSSVHPGPGVTCIPGYNAALAVLKDISLKA